MVVAMNSDTGAVVSTQPAPLRADDVLYDGAAHRLFVPGGEGFLGIYSTSNPDHLQIIGRLSTAVGAKTGLLLPDQHELVLAASPGDSGNAAKILFYKLKD